MQQLITYLLAAVLLLTMGCKTEVSNTKNADNADSSMDSKPFDHAESMEHSLENQQKEILRAQLSAFNAKDVEGLCKNLHADFKWYYLGDDELLLEVAGIEPFRAGMQEYFESIPSVSAELSDIVGTGGFYSFVETVSWDTKDKRATQEALTIYQLKEDKIFRVWYGAAI